MLPEIQEVQTKDFSITRFLGLNQKDTSDDEMFTDMKNMTSDEYPYLYPREKSAIRTVFPGADFLVLGTCVVGEDIYTVQTIPRSGNVNFYKNYELVENVDLDQTNHEERNIFTFGAYIIILPDNVMYHTETEEAKQMDYSSKKYSASFYLSDNKGKILMTTYAMPDLGDNIRTNDQTITNYFTTNYNIMLPVCLEKETIYYDDSSTTEQILPIGVLLGDKSKVEQYTDKTSYPIYWVSILSDNSVSIEKYNKEMSMWSPIDLYNTYYLEYSHGAESFTKLKETINEGDFIKLNALKSNSTEVEEDDTNEIYYKFIKKYRNRAKITKLSIQENVTKNSVSIDAMGITFADPDNLMLACIRKAGNITFDGVNNQKIIVDMYNILGFPYSTIAHLCDIAEITKDIPKMDYVTISNNRIWGCSSENHEIYSSKQGDPTSWYNYSGLASDSYAVTIPSGNKFTGAVTYNEVPYFFTETNVYSLMGNKPKNFQVQNFELRGVEDGAYKTIAQKDGYVYYKSKSGIERFNGNNSQLLTEYLDLEGYKGYHGQMNNDKYFVFLGKNVDSTRLYVYDVKKRLWHIDRTSHSMQMIELDNNLYMTTKQGQNLVLIKLNGKSEEVADILVDNDPVYDNPEWFVESGELNAKDVLNKYITKCMFELKAEENASLKISFMYDESGEWEEVFRTLKRHEKKLIKVPIKVRRCERMRYRISGKGMSKVYSLVLTYEGGSEIG